MIDIGLNQETATGAAGITGLVAFGKLIYNDWVTNKKRAAIYERFKEHRERMDALEKKVASMDASLLAYMLEVEKTYARETAMQQSLAGVHDALDSVRRDLSGDMRTISN